LPERKGTLHFPARQVLARTTSGRSGRLHVAHDPDDVLHLAELRLKALDTPVRASFTLHRALPHEVVQHMADTDLVVLSRGESRSHVNTPGPVTRTALYHAPRPVLAVR
jgi:hypothetical protein